MVRRFLGLRRDRRNRRSAPSTERHYRPAGLDPGIEIRKLTPRDVPLLRSLNALFGDAFGEAETYAAAPPSDDYLDALLGREAVLVLVAHIGELVIAGLVAYELPKFERERRELYIYDLAVAAEYRRQGIATALVEHLRGIAQSRGDWVIYVQADLTDRPAIALYEKLGVRENVLHFDIAVDGKT